MTTPRTCQSCKHWSRDELRTGWRGAVSITHWTEAGDDPLTYEQRQQIEVDVAKRFGSCGAIPEGWDLTAPAARDVKAVCWDGSEYRASVYTRDDFGCVLHELPIADDLGDGR